MKHSLIILTTLLLIAGCGKTSEPIQFGEDQCSFCRMTIAHHQFGAELITDKGRVLKYDAAECMINHIHKGAPQYEKLLAIAHDDPKKLYSVDSLHFVISSKYRSPMGANLAAFQDKSSILAADTTLTWTQVMARLKKTP